MVNPENQIKIKDISTKVSNTRDELMKSYVIKKPFIIHGYKSEEERIKNEVYNNRLLFNLPDYPDIHSNSLEKNKNKNNKEKKIIKYDFNIEIPKKIETINSEIDMSINEENNIKNNNLLNSIINDNISKRTNKRRKSLLNYQRNTTSPRRLSISEKKIYTDLLKNKAIFQPKMRFKPRTDLERVYDMLHLQSLKENDRQIVERQLESVDLLRFKKPKELLNTGINKDKNELSRNNGRKYNILPNPLIEEQKKELEKSNNKVSVYGKSNIYFEPKNNDNKLWARKENLNKEAIALLKSYHYKTQFKATEEIQFKIKKKKYHSPNHGLEIKSNFLIPNLFFTKDKDIIPKNTETYIIKNNNFSELDTKKDLFNFGVDLYKEDEKSFEYTDYDEMTKIFHNNPNLGKNNFKPNSESMKILTKMAFKKERKLFENDDKQNYKYDINKSKYRYNLNKKEKNNNTLSNENIHDVAKFILDECKINSMKSKYNNTSLKSRSGKTMITKGLSVQDFLKKYKLNS